MKQQLQAEIEAALRRVLTDAGDTGPLPGFSLEVARLRAEADALESDRFAIERAIRERLRFARSGETVVRFSAADPSSPRFP